MKYTMLFTTALGLTLYKIDPVAVSADLIDVS